LYVNGLTADDPYIITAAAQLDEIRNFPAGIYYLKAGVEVIKIIRK
jgi:hypothetical protein